MIALDSIPAYLYFGYLPRYANSFESKLDTLTGPWRSRDFASIQESQLVDLGVESLSSTFRTMINNTSAGKTHVLPLSGGLDSRAILGGLLDNADKNQIQTVTFGTPGTWDYEIGQQVARTVGVRCEPIDLTKGSWRWNTNDLVETATQTKSPVWVFDAYVNRQVVYRYGTGSIYWSGFMGDPLAGSHLLPTDSADWWQAQTFFVQRNRFVRSLELVPAGFDPKRHLPEKPFSDNTPLCYDEQLDFGIRQQCLIRHIVLPTGYDYQTPFLHTEWINFILNVPRSYRAGQYLYKEILKAAYPALFSLPTKTNYGFPLSTPSWRTAVQLNRLRLLNRAKRYLPQINWGISPSINYIDFDWAIRDREDLKQTVYENIQDLKKRGVVDWVDIDAIWQRHQRKEANHADALVLLTSLEINLKAADRK